MKKLPIGQQDFENLQNDGCIYVDKTAYIHEMLTSGGRAFFLSRPRRFGKSLLLNTVKSIFQGKKELFKDLYIEDKIDWQPYPVVMIDLSKNAESVKALQGALSASLRNNAELHRIQLDDIDDPSVLLEQLIIRLYLEVGKQVVVLVDEYDKPILDKIDDLGQANEIRKMLQTFYGVLKASSSYMKFLMVTGITKVSQTSIFSGFNNLKDISFDNRYAGICGYTQEELEYNFSEYIQSVAARKKINRADMLTEIQRWYNGYSWDAKTFVYNPFSVLLLFDQGRFKPHWYSTGTPTFLLKLLKTDDNLETVLQNAIGVFDTFTDGQALENLGTIALLFQSGYLTIKRYEEAERSYELQIPNEEVRIAIAELILLDLNNEDDARLHELSKNIRLGFSNGNTDTAISSMKSLLANTTYNTHSSNENESHYQALFQLALTLSGIDHRSESLHSNGRTDAVLIFDKHVYVIEIKYARNKESLETALNNGMTQIKKSQYALPYTNQGKTIHLLALAFTKGDVSFTEEVLD